MGRAGFNEIIPALLWQRGQFLTWPAEQKRAALEERGIKIVVNLWHKIDTDLSPGAKDYGRVYIHWHLSPSQPAKGTNLMVEMLVSLLNRGNGMLIHCEAGRGRSVWLTTELVRRYSGMSYDEAYAFVKARVPGADVRPELAGTFTEASA